jgi:hypothetical protein
MYPLALRAGKNGFSGDTRFFFPHTQIAGFGGNA